MDESTLDNAQEIQCIVYYNMTLFVRPVVGNVMVQLHYCQYPHIRVWEVYSGQLSL